MLLPVVTSEASKTADVSSFMLPGMAWDPSENDHAVDHEDVSLSPTSRASHDRASEASRDQARSSTPFGVGEWATGWGFQHIQPVFADAEDLKERVRSSLFKPTYSVTNFYKETGMWQAVARHPRFENLTLLIITVNALWVAIDTDNNHSDLLSGAHPAFQVAEHFFCTFFLIEWIVRFMAFKHKQDGLKDGWFVFDTLLALMTVLETWVMTIAIGISSDMGHLAKHDSSALRLLRLLRLCRVARVARLLRAMPDLMILIKGLGVAIRSVFFTFALLLFIIYIFSIACTQLAAGTSVGTRYFNSVLSSMYTLFLRGALLDNISILLGETLLESLPVTFLLFVFILMATITVMNMLIGVLCQVVTAVAAVEKEELVVSSAKNKLEDIVRTLDIDQDSQISKEEFAGLLDNAAAAKALQEVGVDAVGLVDYADVIFENEAGDGYDKTLSFTKFMEVVLDLRGSCTATVKDIVDLRKYMRRVTSRSNEQVEQTSSRLMRIEDKLDKLLGLSGGSPRGPSRSPPSKGHASRDASPKSAIGPGAGQCDEQATPRIRSRQGSVESLGGRSSIDAWKDGSPNSGHGGSQSWRGRRPGPVCTSPGSGGSHQDVLRLLVKLDGDVEARFAELERCLQVLAREGQPQRLQRDALGGSAICASTDGSPLGLAQKSALLLQSLPAGGQPPTGSQSSSPESLGIGPDLDSLVMEAAEAVDASLDGANSGSFATRPTCHGKHLGGDGKI